MKVIKLFSTIILLTTGIATHAIRSVGNGGGEAELIALQRFEALPVWAKFCQENPGICFLDLNAGYSLIRNLSRAISEINNIRFVNQSEFKTPIENKTLILTHESLFQDEQHPKPRLEIFKILIGQVLKSQNLQGQVSVQAVLDAEIQLHSDGLSAVIHGDSQDHLVSLQKNAQNLNQEVLQLLQTQKFQISGLLDDGYLAATTQGTFEIHIHLSPTGRLQLNKNLHFGSDSIF